MYLSSGTKALDNLMGGGFRVGKLHTLYGEYKIGKSVLGLQTSCMCTRDIKYGGLNKPALIIDSELFWDSESFKQWYSWFKDRWPDLSSKPKVDIIQYEDIFQVARELGFAIVIQRKEAKTEPIIRFPRKREKPGEITKHTYQREDWLEISPLWKRIERKDYGLVIIDSFSVLFKDVFESLQQNFPGRASAERVFLSGLRALSGRKNLVTIIICHESAKKPWGGESIPYYAKSIVGLFQADKLTKQRYGDTEVLEKKGKISTWQRVRKFYRFRHPTLPDGAEVPVVLKLNTGFVDPVEPSLEGEI